MKIQPLPKSALKIHAHLTDKNLKVNDHVTVT